MECQHDLPGLDGKKRTGIKGKEGVRERYISKRSAALDECGSSAYRSLQELNAVHLNQREAFLFFSRMHLDYDLRRDTMFLAFQIFCRVDRGNEFRELKKWKLHCVSIFLAMKYEEIYPPTLGKVARHQGWDLKLKEYRKLEYQVLTTIGSNLHFQLLNQQLQLEMGESSEQMQMRGVFLLEMSIDSCIIYTNYPRQTILQAITILAKDKDPSLLAPYLLTICQQLARRARSIQRAHGVSPWIYHKYQSTIEQYLSPTLP